MSFRRLRNTILQTDTANLRRFYMLHDPPIELVGGNSISAQSGAVVGFGGAPSHSIPNFPASFNDGVNDHILGDSGADIDDMSAISIVAYLHPLDTSAGLGHGQHIVNKRISFNLVDDTGNGNSGSEINFQVDRTSDMKRRTAIGATGRTDNRWMLAGASWDGTLTAASVDIYLDGGLIASSSAAQANGAGARVSDAGDTLRIGCNDGAGCVYGYLSFVAIWESVRTAQEMRLIYDAMRAYND